MGGRSANFLQIDEEATRRSRRSKSQGWGKRKNMPTDSAKAIGQIGQAIGTLIRNTKNIL